MGAMVKKVETGAQIWRTRRGRLSAELQGRASRQREQHVQIYRCKEKIGRVEGGEVTPGHQDYRAIRRDVSCSGSNRKLLGEGAI